MKKIEYMSGFQTIHKRNKRPDGHRIMA